MSEYGQFGAAAAASAPASNRSYKINDSTLGQGHLFDTETKIKIAKALDSFGVDYIQLPNPGSSEQSFQDFKTIGGLGLKAKISTRIPFNMDDAKRVVELGTQRVNLSFGRSSLDGEEAREDSQGESTETFQKTAVEVVEYLRSQKVEIEVSLEGMFRLDLGEVLDKHKFLFTGGGVGYISIPDADGLASPLVMNDHVVTIHLVWGNNIACHFHDENGCAVANAVTAFEDGATYFDTSVLGIGEPNGLTPLGAFMARMVVSSPDYTKSTYNLKELKDLEILVAEAIQVSIPFNNPVTGFSAFYHKAGIHAKAILANPSTYEVIDPAVFGLTRNVAINSRITGWNAVRSRVDALGLTMTDDQVKEATARIKEVADVRPLRADETDALLRSFHEQLSA